jgi:hypothetical protein
MNENQFFSVLGVASLSLRSPENSRCHRIVIEELHPNGMSQIIPKLKITNRLSDLIMKFNIFIVFKSLFKFRQKINAVFGDINRNSCQKIVFPYYSN